MLFSSSLLYSGAACASVSVSVERAGPAKNPPLLWFPTRLRKYQKPPTISSTKTSLRSFMFVHPASAWGYDSLASRLGNFRRQRRRCVPFILSASLRRCLRQFLQFGRDPLHLLPRPLHRPRIVDHVIAQRNLL